MNHKDRNKQAAKELAVSFTDNAWGDYQYWLKNDDKTFNRINELINECKKNPFKGIGKPEPLKDNLTGYWSRRINQVDRLVYLPEDNAIYIVACRFHY